MKILHICLSCFYIDANSYQENMIIKAHVDKGYDVRVLASTETYNEKGNLIYLSPCEYNGDDGAIVTRIPYFKYLPHFLAKKVRYYPNAIAFIKDVNPDLIYFHGLPAFELYRVSKLSQKKGIRLVVDSHEDYINSARTFLSRNVLHRLYYKWVIRASLRYIKKIYCVTEDTIDFCKSMYGIDENQLEFLPMGGKIFSDEEYDSRRFKFRKKYNYDDNELVCAQTGRFTEDKKLIENIEIINCLKNKNFHLVLAGIPNDRIRPKLEYYLNESLNIDYIGWCNKEEMFDLLCGIDVYIQPGSQSATLQSSICARCAVVATDTKTHRFYINGNGWLINSVNDLYFIYDQIINNPKKILEMKKRSENIANNKLSYDKIAEYLVSCQAITEHDILVTR